MSEITTITQSLSTLKSLGKDFEAIKANWKARREAARGRLEATYGKLADAAMDEILRAEDELAVCEKCAGACPFDERKPVIGTDGAITYVLCEYELRRRAQAAKIPPQYLGKTFADYEVTPDNSEAVKIAKWFVAEKPSKSLYLYGKCGTGKTFLASIMALGFISGGKRVIFGDVPTLLGELKRQFDGGDVQAILDRYAKCDLLVLDDLGAGLLSEWGVGIIYQIINARSNALKRLVVTSNFDYKGLEARLRTKDAYSAERIISRFNGMCVPAFLGLTDRRKQR